MLDKLILSRKYRNFGFTLAEVLITLGIIGVVAVLTIMVIIPNIDEQQTRSAFLKQASLLQQAANQYLSDNGGTFLNEFTNQGDVIKRFLSVYYKTTKVCDVVSDTTCLDTSIQDLNDASLQPISTGIRTLDGTYIVAQNTSSQCTGGSSCVQGYIDINGSKGPNRVGYDIFWWYLTPQKIVFYRPDVALDHPRNTSCVKPPNTGWDVWANSGQGCGLRMIQGLPRWQ